jgi:hypothetical protein
MGGKNSTFNFKTIFFYKTSEIHKLNKRLEKIDGAIKNGQSRDTGNIGHTRHKTQDKQDIIIIKITYLVTY